MSYINKKIVSKILGFLLVGEAIFIFLSALISLIYKESDFGDIVLSASITLFGGGFFIFLGKGAKKEIGKREGYLIVALSWVIFSLFGSLPFLLSGGIPSFTDAYFETH